MTISPNNNILQRVLVIDDDPILCAIAEAHFRHQGSGCVQTAMNGENALEILDRTNAPPSFLLVDLNMPRMDGIQFLRHLEERKFAGAIVILSAQSASIVALAEALAQKHQLKIIGSLPKPLITADLDKLIASAAETFESRASTVTGMVSPDDLRMAIVNSEILPYYQPKIDLATGRVVGVEALARWKHRELGLIAPASFIPVAERYNFIDTLTDVILRAATLDVRHWSTLGFDLKCAVNLSACSLTNLDMPDKYEAFVDAAGLSPLMFIFEVTESTLLKKEVVPMEVLARLRLKGFDLSIDDFGTGGSNLEHLRDFPFCELKIDKSFIHNMDTNPFSHECVRTSVDLAKKLDLRLVAEGIETRKVLNAVKAFGIHQAQGYYYSRPMSSDDLLKWVKAYQVSRQNAAALNRLEANPAA